MTPVFQAFCRQLQYQFNDMGLLDQALTHRSASSRHNERLEFLGDSLLGQVIAAQLYHLFPDASEGELSRMRSSLVREKTLADIATEMRLGEILHLGSGELKSGGFRRASILADSLEAVFGAIYLDGGFPECERVILNLYQQRLNDLPDKGTEKDPKTTLQEWLQAQRLPLPIYDLIASYGEAHAQTFHVSCALSSGEQAEGRGSSRRKAEQQAARKILEQLKVES